MRFPQNANDTEFTKNKTGRSQALSSAIRNGRKMAPSGTGAWVRIGRKRSTRAQQARGGHEAKRCRKNFGLASLVVRGVTTYTFRRCDTIHIGVTFSFHPKITDDFSPEDVIVSVTAPYLQRATTD